MRRTTRRLALTEAGIEFLARSRTILSSLNDAREVAGPGRGAAGLLVVSLPVSFGLSQLGPVFPALIEKHPRLSLDLRFEDRFVDLLSDGVDLAIRAGAAPPDSPFVVARRLATIDRVLCASPAFIARHGKPTALAALPSFPCVGQGTGAVSWSFIIEDALTWVRVDGRLRSNNVFSLREAALAGIGVARLPLWIVDEDLKKRRLVRLLPNVEMPAIDVVGIFHTAAKGSPAIRATLDFLAAELPKRTSMRAPGVVPAREA